jgi:alkylation response protein AidB-like acyl-CoA dehydrogenase
MNTATDHRAMLRDSVADFTARTPGIERMRRLRGDPAEYDRAVWRQMGELGWLGILVPERYGGMGLGLAEAAIVAEGLARVLAPEPYTAAAVLAARVIDASGNEAFRQDKLPQLAAGALIPALAWQERAGVLDAAAVTTRAVPFEGGFRISGAKRFIAGAAGADGVLVTARADAEPVVVWIPRDAAGAALDLEPLADGRHFGALTLTDVAVPAEHVLARGAAALAALARALDHAAAVAGAELYGVMGRALEMSLDYMKTRVQFGKPIGSFQALQHRAVDLYIQRELASAVLEETLRELDAEPAAERRAALASRVKARCSDAGLRITREAIQIHGAIGFTDEYDAGLYLKRAMVLAAWLGTAAHHRRRYAALALQREAA